MFSKKFLSFLALVFVGSQISSVSATIAACSDTQKAYTAGSDCVAASYCIDEQLIYGVKDDAPTCKIALDGVFAFNESTGAIIDLGTFDIATAGISTNFVLYNCDGTKCAKTSGIVKDSTNASFVVAAAGGTSAASSHEDTSCSAVGKINTSDSNVLCITTTLKASKSDSRYIMSNVVGNAFETGDSDNDKSIIIKTAANIFAYDNLLTGTDYCVDDNGEVFDRKSGLCKATIASGEDCTSYYDCTDGVCTLTTANKRSTGGSDVPDPSQCVPKDSTVTHCVDGYYITSSDGSALITNTDPGKLWNCKDGSCEAKPLFIGYFVNEDSGKPEILCKVVSDAQQCNIVTIGHGATCSTVGDLITSTEGGTDYQICLATSVAGIALSSYNDKQMMISIDKTNGLYGIKPNTIASDSNTSFSLVIKVDGNNVQVVKETTPIRYKYIKTGSTDKIVYTRTAAKSESAGDGICGTGSPFEYKLDQWTSALQTNTFAEFYVEGTNA